MSTIVRQIKTEDIKAAGEVLKQGGIVAFPTDTVYGLGAVFDDEKAVRKIFAAKGREEKKPLSILVADSAQVELLSEIKSGEMVQKAERLMEKYWPGALTIIIRKKAGLPADLTSNDLVGLRIPDHDFTRELIRRTGPLAVTSANISGEPPARSVADFAEELGPQLDIIIDGGPSRGGVPSSVINCDADPAVVLREGAIPGKDLMSC